MGRAPCCSKVGLHKGPWTPREDTLLRRYIEKHGEGNWRSVPKKAGLLRCGKSCRLRWMNYLRPNIKRGNIEADEDDLIIKLHALLGNRWSLIARRLPGRTDNEIKNHWNTHLSKTLKRRGIDPRTHRPLCPSILDGNPHYITQEGEKNVSNSEAAALEFKHDNAVKVHVPKANRVNPFTFFLTQRYDAVQLPTLNQMQDIGPEMEISSSVPNEDGIAMEERQSPIEKDELSASPSISELSSWADGQNWFVDDPNMLDKVYDEFLDLIDYNVEENMDASGINCPLDQQGQVVDGHQDWAEHVSINSIRAGSSHCNIVNLM